MKNNAGNGMHHGGEGGYGKNVASDFNGALFGGAFDFLQAFGMGHRADVSDIEKDFAGLRKEEGREFAVVGPGASDGSFVNGAGLSVEKERDGGDVGVRAIHANVTLALLLGIIERMRVGEGPDKLTAYVFQAEFEMGVLIDRVMPAEESGGADVEALLVVDFFWSNEARRIAGAG